MLNSTVPSWWGLRFVRRHKLFVQMCARIWRHSMWKRLVPYFKFIYIYKSSLLPYYHHLFLFKVSFKNMYEDPCFSMPCFNAGKCHVENSKFRCECQPGFHGNYCEACNFFLDKILLSPIKCVKMFSIQWIKICVDALRRLVLMDASAVKYLLIWHSSATVRKNLKYTNFNNMKLESQQMEDVRFWLQNW